MLLINCELNLILTWSTNYVIASIAKQEVTVAQRDNPPVFDNCSTCAILAITDAKLDVPFITLLPQDDNKLLK